MKKFEPMWITRKEFDEEGRSYTLLTCSFVGVLSANTVHNISPFSLHPWRTGGSDVVMVIVPGLWIVAPRSPGWKTVVYPSLAILFTLINGVFRPGRMSAALAVLLSCWSGNSV